MAEEGIALDENADYRGPILIGLTICGEPEFADVALNGDVVDGRGVDPLFGVLVCRELELIVFLIVLTKWVKTAEPAFDTCVEQPHARVVLMFGVSAFVEAKRDMRDGEVVGQFESRFITEVGFECFRGGDKLRFQ
jgi:hypothetical protein